MIFNRKQRGGIFGLDARVALIIFTVLTLVSGYTGLRAYSQLKAQGFVSELRAISKGMSQMEMDTGQRAKDILATCIMPDCLYDTYRVLFDETLVSSAYLSRWHGPYITPQSIPHPQYGIGYVDYYQSSMPTACTNGSPCYNWITWAGVKLSDAALANVNDMVDGASELNPDSTGEFRWADNGDGTFVVYSRMGKSISN